MHRSLRRSLIVLLCTLSMLLAIPSSALAWNFNGGFYTNSAIADGTLSVCFDSGAIYTNKSSILHGLDEWGQVPGAPITIDFYENPGDSLWPCSPGANVDVKWANLDNGQCLHNASAVPPNGGSYGYILINVNCQNQGVFYWGYSTPVPAGFVDIYTVMAHEGGHLLGLDHTAGAYHLMSTGSLGNYICPGGDLGVRIQYMSADDGNGMRARYPGLATTGGFPTSDSCVT